MGMYDTITVLTGVACECGCIVTEFQTKDLDNVLTQYKIDKQGYLLRGTYNPIRKKYTQWRKCIVTRDIIIYNWCPGCEKRSLGRHITVVEGKVFKQSKDWCLP